MHCAGGKAGNPLTSTASTIPVHCADGNAGKVKRERRQAEPWSVRLGQSDSSGYGPEICELEEKIQNLAIKEERSMQALYEELLKFSPQEDAELLRKTMGQEIKEVQDRTEEWGSYVEDKFKDYLLINEFEDLFVSTTEGLKEQDTQLRENT